MSENEPRATDNEPQEAPAPPGPEPQGIVEELRHEIEEVVEHVPKPVRWTVRKLVLLGLVGIVGLVVLAVVSVLLFYANRTELAARELTLYLNHTLATRSNVRIEVSDIRGNPFQRIRLVRPRVAFREDGRSLLEAPWIELGYSPWSLLRRDGRAVEVTVDSPVIHLERGTDGRLRLPTWKTTGRTAKATTWDVHFRMRNGQVDVPSQPSVLGLDFDALLATGPQSRATIRSLKWRSGPYDTHDLALKGEIASGDSVLFHIERLSTAAIELAGKGGWRKGERAKWVHVDLKRLNWRWLAGVTRNGTFDVPGEAAATVEARGDTSWTGAFTTRLGWNGADLEGRGSFQWRGERLRVEPLAVTSTAGELLGFATWSVAGWDVGGDVVHGEPSQWQAIGIPGWPKGDLNGRFVYTVDTRQHESNGTLTALLRPSELAGWRADSTSVSAVLPAKGTRTFDVHAVRRGGRLDLQGATLAGGWGGQYRVESLPLDEWPDGRASGIRGLLETGTGTVQSANGALSVSGELTGRNTDWFGMHAARWRLGSMQGALMPAPNLNAEAGLRDVMFLGVHFDSVASPIHLGDRALDLIATSAQAGDTLMTLAGRADWTREGWRLELARAAARSSRFHWVAEPPVQLAGDPKGVTFQRLEARDSTASMSVTGRWAGPGGQYDWRAEARGLELTRLGLPLDWGLDGTVSGALKVQGMYGDPRWTFDGRAGHPAFNGHRGDSLDLALSGAMTRVGIERARFQIGGGVIAAHGRIDRMRENWPDSLTGTAVLRWLVGAGAWSGEVDAKAFPIDRVTGLFPGTRGWGGHLEGGADISGSPADPVLALHATVTPLTWRDFTLERLQAEMRYANEKLTVTRLRAGSDRMESSAEGTVPLRLAFNRRWELLDQPMDATIRVRQGDLRLLPRLVPQIAAAAGSIEADATIRGTAVSPNLDGRGRITGGSLRLAGRDEVLEGVQAWFRMNASTITLDSLVARQGQEGRLRASGTVTLQRLAPSGYNLKLRVRNFAASDPGIYAAQFDGDFTVTDGPRVRGQWLPYVAGSARVQRAVILIDFANQSEGAQLAASNPPLYWVYRIDLAATSNLHWQPPDGDIEFSADLTAEQTITELRVFGEMRALRGTYYFLSNRFNVDQAILTFDNVSGLNPTIDAQATTRVVPLDLGVQSSDRVAHDVVVKITGRAREPLIGFDSRPSDWDENEILRQLTVGRFVANGTATRDPFDNYLTRAINRTLSAEMSRAFRGYLNDWVIDREQGGLFAGKGEVIVGVGSQVTPNLMLRYRQRVPGLGREPVTQTVGATPFERDIEAEYRLNRFFLISSELTQRRPLTGSAANTAATPDFNLSLKARWEY
jgi:hypothetical protein